MMANKKRKFPVGFVLIVLLLVIGVGLVFGFFAIRERVRQLFGSPAAELSIVQRVLYPIELFLHREKLTTAQPGAEDEVRFTINSGESVALVCLRLEQAGLIPDAEILRTYLVYTGLDRNLQSGDFSLNTAMTPVEIGNAFQDRPTSEAVISILPGWRIEEVAANVAASGLNISAEVFTSKAYVPEPHYFAWMPVQKAVTLEGYLLPGIYELPRESDLDVVFELLLTSFTSQVDQSILDGFARQGLTIHEAVTLASIVEKEAVVDEEKPMIASVFYNRLAQGMRLETDPTVQYALGFNEETNSWWKSPLASADLAVNSPYNTYIVFGLPPTPICNPGLDSLRAVAFPAETPYFFFRSACDGSGRHNFAITFEEHLNNSCE